MTQHAGRRRSMIAVAASVVLAVVAVVVLFIGLHGSDGPPQPAADAGQPVSASGPASTGSAGSPTAGKASDTSQPSSGAKNVQKGADLGPILQASPPVAIDIPSIGVRTRSLVRLGLAADGSLEVPQDFASVGWFTSGPTPGQLGPAILAGHVDSHNGPAIFYRLGALRPGAQVSVTRKDGSTAKFTVDRIKRFAKDRFPVLEVYGNTHRAELRLITCGGSFDQKTGHYLDNIVAFAHLVS